MTAERAGWFGVGVQDVGQSSNAGMDTHDKLPVAQDPEASESPQGEMETKLAAIWIEVLKRGRVGRNEDFFDLGGDSLASTQLVSRIRAVFGIEVPLRQMFETPTVAGLAEYIGTIQWASAESAGEAPGDDRTEIEI